MVIGTGERTRSVLASPTMGGRSQRAGSSNAAVSKQPNFAGNGRSKSAFPREQKLGEIGEDDNDLKESIIEVDPSVRDSVNPPSS